MSMNKLEKIGIAGYKSIASTSIKLGDINVLIGANGAGKSNLCQLIEMQCSIAKGMLQNFILNNGKREGYFYRGPKSMPHIWASYDFEKFSYDIFLKYGPEQVFIELEKARYVENKYHCVITANEIESLLKLFKDNVNGIYQKYDGEEQDCGKLSHELCEIFSNWRSYHFRDTSVLSAARRGESVHEYRFLRSDGSNIAPFIKHFPPEKYKQLLNIVRLTLPNFNDFVLEPETQGNDVIIRLQWTQTGSDYVFQPHQLSDGTLSFICIVAALIGEDDASLIVFDEPELGLHPSAITFMVSLIKSVSDKKQIIIATQSPALLDHFDPEDVIVVENGEDGKSEFKRLDCQRLESWLEDYSLSELWNKNELGGRPNAIH